MALLSAIAAIVIVFGAVVLVARGVEVRLTLFAAALLLALVNGNPMAPIRNFFTQMVNTGTVVPICCSLGFAQVVKTTGCDRHLVALLLAPLRKHRSLLIPGVALAAFVVNIP